jgi:hypothetical protein
MLGSVGAFLAELTQTVEDVADDPDDNQADEHVADVAEGLVELRPLAAEGVPDAGDGDDVDRRANEVEHGEPHRRNLHHPGHDRGEGPDHRQHPRHGQRPGTAPDQEPLGPVHVLVRHKDVLAPPVHQRPPARSPNPVGDERPDKLGHDAQHDHQDQAGVLVNADTAGAGRDRTAEKERQLRGDWDAHRLEHAEQDNGVDGVRHEETLHAHLCTASPGVPRPPTGQDTL